MKSGEDIRTVKVTLTRPEFTFLLEHRIHGKTVLPGVFLLDLVEKLADDFQLPGKISPYRWRNLRFLRMAIWEEGRDEMELFLENRSSDTEIVVYQIMEWGRFQRRREIMQLESADIPSSMPDPDWPQFAVDSLFGLAKRNDIYPKIIGLGGTFQVINAIWSEPGEGPSLKAEIVAPMPFLNREAGLQLAYFWGNEFGQFHLLPMGVDELSVYRPFGSGERYFCWLFHRGGDQRENVFDVYYTDELLCIYEIHLGLRMVRQERFFLVHDDMRKDDRE